MISSKLSLVLAGVSMMAVTACTDPNAIGTDPNAKTKNGALIGALTGATIGIIKGDNKEERRKGAIVGGIIGAGGGAVIGSQLDKQEAELRQNLGGTARIVNTGNQLIVTLPQDILFASDSAFVRPDLRSELTTLADSINRYPNTTVNVLGHTDNTGSAAYNLDLSNRRADAVANILMDAGVAPFRVVSRGRGEDQPVATNLTEEGKAQNRRVEIIITPNA